jgi:hypothetical protein
MAQTRRFEIVNSAGRVLFSAARPRFVRRWFTNNSQSLPAGNYTFRRIISNYNFNRRTSLEDSQGEWVDKTLTV